MTEATAFASFTNRESIALIKQLGWLKPVSDPVFRVSSFGLVPTPLLPAGAGLRAFDSARAPGTP